MDSLQLVLAIAFAILTSIGAIGFLVFRQPVHAALSFAVTVLSGIGFYLLQNAPYAAIATVIVYAGATIIIFLFALMFAQSSNLQNYDATRANPVTSVLASIALVSILTFASVSFSKVDDKGQPLGNAVDANSLAETTTIPSVADLGRVMYTRYLWD